MASENKKDLSPDSNSYHRYEIVGDNTTRLSREGHPKIVYVQQVPVRGITLTIGIFFDGTGNNQTNALDLAAAYGNCSNLVGEEKAQACAKFEALSQDRIENSSYRGGITNISRLYDLYLRNEKPDELETEAQIKIYVSGIGTSDGNGDSLLGMALGSSLLERFHGVISKTDDVLEQIVAELNEFKDINKGKITVAKIQFDIFGFSRGAASARHFANRVMDQDPAIIDAINAGLDLMDNHGKAAGEVRFLGLFDTVAAIGSLFNFYNISGRSNPGIKLELPPSVAQKVFQISAMHECRHNFSLNSIKGMWPELALPGVHSDIGGGYQSPTSPLPENEEHFLTMPDFMVVRESTPEIQTAVYQKAKGMREKLYHLPALKYLLPHGKLETRAISWPVRNDNKARAGIYEKKVGAAVLFKREAIPNGWEKVSMRVMLDAAMDAGAVFTPIQDQDEDMILPAELLPLCEKAIAQGRAVRRGQPTTSFTSEEMRIIGRYLHCSANWNIQSDRNLWVSPLTDEVFIRDKPMSMEERSFVWANAPGEGWQRTVWYMDDQQQWEERQRLNVEAFDQLF